MAKSDDREGGGTMFAVYEKDAAIITEFAAAVKAPIDLYVSARQKFNSALALGLGHLDTSAVCKAIETAAGVERSTAVRICAKYTTHPACHSRTERLRSKPLGWRACLIQMAGWRT